LGRGAGEGGGVETKKKNPGGGPRLKGLTRNFEPVQKALATVVDWFISHARRENHSSEGGNSIQGKDKEIEMKRRKKKLLEGNVPPKKRGGGKGRQKEGLGQLQEDQKEVLLV